jgi:CubicO group peptidase (beta-lactamase class C family)
VDPSYILNTSIDASIAGPMSEDPTDRRIHSALEGIVASSKAPGFVVAVNEGGTPRVRYFRGERDVRRHLPVSERTVFGIGSVTKVVTAVAVLQLCEQRQVSLATPVRELLPRLRLKDPRAHRITLEHLLAHSSGLPPLPLLERAFLRSTVGDPGEGAQLFGPAGWTDGRTPIDTYDELADAVSESASALVATPGTEFSYSNEGYALLAAVIEAASGDSYERYVSERVLRPAGMTSSTFDPGIAARGPEVTEPYVLKPAPEGPEVAFAPPWWSAPAMRAAGGLWSSAHDLLQFLEIFRTGGSVAGTKILAPESVRDMLTPRVATQPGEGYGLGITVLANWNGGPLAWKNGGAKAIRSDVAVDTLHGLTGVALANLTESPTRRALMAAFNLLSGHPAEEPPIRYTSTTRPDRALGEYDGFYSAPDGLEVRVESRGDHLWVSSPFGAGVARPSDRDGFLIKEGEEVRFLQFLSDSGRSITALRYAGRVLVRWARASERPYLRHRG